MKKMIVCLLALCLLLPAACAESAVYEGAGYDTPEDAVLAYANAFAKGDVMEMLSTFAVESYVDHFDSKAYFSYIRVYQPMNSAPLLALPDSSEYMRQLRILDQVSSILAGFSRQYVVASGILDLTSDTVRGAYTMSFKPEEPEALDAFLAKTAECVWPGEVTVGPVWNRALFEMRDWGKGYGRYFEYLRAYTGCDEAATVAVVLRIDGMDYLQVMQCVRYGDKWYNQSMSGYVFNAFSAGLSGDTDWYYACGLVPAADMALLPR